MYRLYFQSIFSRTHIYFACLACMSFLFSVIVLKCPSLFSSFFFFLFFISFHVSSSSFTYNFRFICLLLSAYFDCPINLFTFSFISIIVFTPLFIYTFPLFFSFLLFLIFMFPLSFFLFPSPFLFFATPYFFPTVPSACTKSVFFTKSFR